MKEHIQAQMVNELRDIARRFHNYGCLRTLLSACIDKYLIANEEYFMRVREALGNQKGREPVSDSPVVKEPFTTEQPDDCAKAYDVWWERFYNEHKETPTSFESWQAGVAWATKWESGWLLSECKEYLEGCFESDGGELEAQGSVDAKALVKKIDTALSKIEGGSE